ncbi:hypothetical protein BD410DRAFT_104755 [Rickenella mellea]|uniref:Uncharacterized protein n=1 Tax=Rickenella mellea TaxID=50990 RepID=A0A4Y7PJA8_9AGAM|nr:hypothetical protein BD410DRAFT_104755 [Rickenella mellea]
MRTIGCSQLCSAVPSPGGCSSHVPRRHSVTHLFEPELFTGSSITPRSKLLSTTPAVDKITGPHSSTLACYPQVPCGPVNCQSVNIDLSWYSTPWYRAIAKQEREPCSPVVILEAVF